MEIKIVSDAIDSDGLKLLLESASTSPSEKIEYQLRPSGLRFRSVEPTILVAVIGAVGTSITALLTSILSVAKEKTGNHYDRNQGGDKDRNPCKLSGGKTGCNHRQGQAIGSGQDFDRKEISGSASMHATQSSGGAAPRPRNDDEI
jgi:hypothetical protein